MRLLVSGGLAAINGLVAILSASFSLATQRNMAMPLTDPVPAYLLLAFGTLLLANGTLLVLGVRLQMRRQGGAMVIYGVLMIVVGASMTWTNLFQMGMPMLSGVLMLLLGGLMAFSGIYMAVGPEAMRERQ